MLKRSHRNSGTVAIVIGASHRHRHQAQLGTDL